MVDRIPVHLGLLALGQTCPHEIEKHLLLMLVVGRVAGCEFARPVQRQTHGLQLLFHRRDVLVGPRLRSDLALDRGVLGGQAERIPAHRMQHVLALRALEARNHVAHRIVADMAHMDAPRRIGEHLEHVILLARIVVLGGEDRLVVPDALPARFGLAGVVTFVAHGVFEIRRPVRALLRSWTRERGRKPVLARAEFALEAGD